MIDLNRLHTDYQRKPLKGQGRTTDMLVRAAHFADQHEIRVLILTHTERHALRCMRMLRLIAIDMGFDYRPTRPDTLFINSTLFSIASAPRAYEFNYTSDGQVIMDHYLKEITHTWCQTHHADNVLIAMATAAKENADG